MTPERKWKVFYFKNSLTYSSVQFHYECAAQGQRLGRTVGLLTVIPWNCKRHLQKLKSREGGQSNRFSNLSATWLAACLTIFSVLVISSHESLLLSSAIHYQRCLLPQMFLFLDSFDVKRVCVNLRVDICVHAVSFFFSGARHTASCDTATTHAWSHAQRRHDSATSRQRFSRSAQTEPHVVSLWGS